MWAIIYLACSIFDHGGSVTADSVAPNPSVFGGEEGTPALLISSIQSVIDAICIVLLNKQNVKDHFFKLTTK